MYKIEMFKIYHGGIPQKFYKSIEEGESFNNAVIGLKKFVYMWGDTKYTSYRIGLNLGIFAIGMRIRKSSHIEYLATIEKKDANMYQLTIKFNRNNKQTLAITYQDQCANEAISALKQVAFNSIVAVDYFGWEKYNQIFSQDDTVQRGRDLYSREKDRIYRDFCPSIHVHVRL